MFRKPTLEQRLVRLEKLAKKFEAADSELIYQDDLWDVYKINSKKPLESMAQEQTGIF